jgi:hypothetical protein
MITLGDCGFTIRKKDTFGRPITERVITKTAKEQAMWDMIASKERDEEAKIEQEMVEQKDEMPSGVKSFDVENLLISAMDITAGKTITIGKNKTEVKIGDLQDTFARITPSGMKLKLDTARIAKWVKIDGKVFMKREDAALEQIRMNGKFYKTIEDIAGFKPKWNWWKYQQLDAGLKKRGLERIDGVITKITINQTQGGDL